jgi:hypothetical protein
MAAPLARSPAPIAGMRQSIVMLRQPPPVR